VQPIRVNQ